MLNCHQMWVSACMVCQNQGEYSCLVPSVPGTHFISTKTLTRIKFLPKMMYDYTSLPLWQPNTDLFPSILKNVSCRAKSNLPHSDGVLWEGQSKIRAWRSQQPTLGEKNSHVSRCSTRTIQVSVRSIYTAFLPCWFLRWRLQLGHVLSQTSQLFLLGHNRCCNNRII